ncbi:MAG: hypothetical protein KAW95_01475, partial [Dehalococcoidia bacterium]|nr:hypothetical protein [Dehalococcoidia bacterium]
LGGIGTEGYPWLAARWQLPPRQKNRTLLCPKANPEANHKIHEALHSNIVEDSTHVGARYSSLDAMTA